MAVHPKRPPDLERLADIRATESIADVTDNASVTAAALEAMTPGVVDAVSMPRDVADTDSAAPPLPFNPCDAPSQPSHE
jgi:hypothetical protein